MILNLVIPSTPQLRASPQCWEARQQLCNFDTRRESPNSLSAVAVLAPPVPARDLDAA